MKDEDICVVSIYYTDYRDPECFEYCIYVNALYDLSHDEIDDVLKNGMEKIMNLIESTFEVEKKKEYFDNFIHGQTVVSFPIKRLSNMLYGEWKPWGINEFREQVDYLEANYFSMALEELLVKKGMKTCESTHTFDCPYCKGIIKLKIPIPKIGYPCEAKGNCDKCERDCIFLLYDMYDVYPLPKAKFSSESQRYYSPGATKHE